MEGRIECAYGILSLTNLGQSYVANYFERVTLLFNVTYNLFFRSFPPLTTHITCAATKSINAYAFPFMASASVVAINISTQFLIKSAQVLFTAGKFSPHF